MFLTKTSCETAVSLFVSVSVTVSVETCDMVLMSMLKSDICQMSCITCAVSNVNCLC